MRKLLYCFFFLLTFSSQSVAWAQDGRKQETAQKEQPSSTIVLTVSAENRVRGERGLFHRLQGRGGECLGVAG